MKRSFGKLFFAVLAAIAVQATYAGDVTAPAGAVRNLTASDFMPHQNSAKEFNEPGVTSSCLTTGRAHS